MTEPMFVSGKSHSSTLDLSKHYIQSIKSESDLCVNTPSQFVPIYKTITFIRCDWNVRQEEVIIASESV